MNNASSTKTQFLLILLILLGLAIRLSGIDRLDL